MLDYISLKSKYWKTLGISFCVAVSLAIISGCDLTPGNEQRSEKIQPSSSLRNSEDESDNSSAPFSASVTPLEARLGSSKGTPEELGAVWKTPT